MRKNTAIILVGFLMTSISCFGQCEKHTHFFGGGIDFNSWEGTLTELELNATYGYYFANKSAVGGEFSLHKRNNNNYNLILNTSVGAFYRYNLHPFPYVFIQPSYFLTWYDNEGGPNLAHLVRFGLGINIPITESFAIELISSESIGIDYKNLQFDPYHFRTQIRLIISLTSKTKKL